MGTTGTINNFLGNTVRIIVDEDGIPRSSQRPNPVWSGGLISDLTRLFELGELVEVKVGKYKGRSGQVADFNSEKEVMRIADLRRNEVVSCSFSLCARTYILFQD